MINMSAGGLTLECWLWDVLLVKLVVEEAVDFTWLVWLPRPIRRLVNRWRGCDEDGLICPGIACSSTHSVIWSVVSWMAYTLSCVFLKCDVDQVFRGTDDDTVGDVGGEVMNENTAWTLIDTWRKRALHSWFCDAIWLNDFKGNFTSKFWSVSGSAVDWSFMAKFHQRSVSGIPVDWNILNLRPVNWVTLWEQDQEHHESRVVSYRLHHRLDKDSIKTQWLFFHREKRREEKCTSIVFLK